MIEDLNLGIVTLGGYVYKNNFKIYLNLSFTVQFKMFSHKRKELQKRKEKILCHSIHSLLGNHFLVLLHSALSPLGGEARCLLRPNNSCVLGNYSLHKWTLICIPPLKSNLLKRNFASIV